MSHRTRALALALCALPACAGRTAADTAAPTTTEGASWTLDWIARGAVLLADLGAYGRPITTSSRQAQVFFDQGLTLAYGFNHDEAARSFARAGQIDPSCAMCWWGVAYTLGPNYNFPLLPERAQAQWDALARARAAAATAAPVEKALIDALAQRIPGPAYLDPAAMKPYHQAYADAMRGVAGQFPADLDVQALYAESMMMLRPWQLWTPAGQAAEGTAEIVATLEQVLARSPGHIGANHFYIHAVEASRHPERALASALRLGKLAPGAGHLVHMPAHIFQRVGRYAEAAAANRGAIAADLKYFEQITPLGYYPFYLGHNYGFLAYSTAMMGRRAESLASARESAQALPHDVVCSMPGMDFFWALPLFVMVRFGQWDAILAEPPPMARHAVQTALWHHARGMALAATGRADDAKAEVAELRAIAASVPADMNSGLNDAGAVLELGALVVEARIADVVGASDAIDRWRAAVEREDQLAYNEPADWFYPVRHYLGAALLDAGRLKEAEQVYRDDLERNPENGWALFGLWRSLLARQQLAEAAKVEQRFRAAWAQADIELVRTAY